ncbi:F-box protein At2g14500-like [Zingiber officinale]|uniref:F-box protein At2g14500-like n=1 Tax=Zingiber officinale TaxID=94328 RepID=UPI001C4BD308|nr:F-box protein At2g14500-like [Zingiber officinale]
MKPSPALSPSLVYSAPMAGGSWSHLPLDLFSLIFSKLSLPQFLRSAAVCASWSAAVGDLSARGRCVMFRGQSHWLVLNNDDNRSAVVTFYALDEAREYTIPVPDPPISDRIFLGSAHGWIITMDVRLRVQLLNPIIGAQIDLPGFVLLSEHTHPIRDTAGRLIGFRMPTIPVDEEELQVRRCPTNGYNLTHLCLEQHHLKAILSADPSLGDGYTVALIQYPSGRIFFISSGDEKWLELHCSISIENMVFHKGKLYVSTLSVVYFCDLDEARIRHGEIPRFRVVDRSRHLAMPRFGVVDRAQHLTKLHYLFETPRGDLLSIWKERNETKTISVEVYRVMIDDDDEEEERVGKGIDMLEFILSFGNSESMAVVDKQLSMLREEAKDLGDLSVFLGGRHPFCLSPRDFPAGHLTPNSIYFMDDHYDIIDIRGETELDAYYRLMFEDLVNLQQFSAPIRSVYLLPLMFMERNWLRKILNCRIDNKTFVRLYWQPPSTSFH